MAILGDSKPETETLTYADVFSIFTFYHFHKASNMIYDTLINTFKIKRLYILNTITCAESMALRKGNFLRVISGKGRQTSKTL